MAALATAAPRRVTRHQQSDTFLSTPGAVPHSQKMKTNQLKKAEFIREGDKLKNQFMNIEKDKNILLFSKKNDFRMEYSMLEEMEHRLAKNQKAEKVKIQQKLAKIHNNVKGLQRQLKDVKPSPEFVERLREMMEEVETSINTFKEEQRKTYEELMRDEKTTANELNALEKKIELWALGALATERIFKQSMFPLDKGTKNHLPDEILELERFLQQTGGRQGGWDEYDHQVFLKVHTKHKGKPSYMDEILDCLPGRTREDIQQHEKWYQEFLILDAQKKETIQKWKMKKQQERDKFLAEKEKLLTPTVLQCEEARKQKVEEQRKKQLEELETWKRQKATEYAMKQAAQLREEEEKEKKKQREQRRRLQMKLLLEDYSRQKKEQEELLRQEKEEKEEAEREKRKQIAAEEILKFQERDLHKLELKILEKQAKEDEKIEKEKRLSKLREKVEINVIRDPYRLYRPTKVWEERTKDIGPAGTGPLLHIPHRAIPTWRQEL
uniref:Coiled-coil domain containing 112 n=1 Tax=Salvator merianae TaxID=96440 RepID=A0A8D0B633_SALMN